MEYFEKTFKIEKVKGLESLDFRIKKMDPSKLLTIIMASGHLVTMKDLDLVEEINKKILASIEFNGGGKDWQPLIRNNGTSSIDELDSNPLVALKLTSKFHELVVQPAFLE